MGGRRDWRKEGKKGRGKGREGEGKGGIDAPALALSNWLPNALSKCSVVS